MHRNLVTKRSGCFICIKANKIERARPEVTGTPFWRSPYISSFAFSMISGYWDKILARPVLVSCRRLSMFSCILFFQLLFPVRSSILIYFWMVPWWRWLNKVGKRPCKVLTIAWVWKFVKRAASSICINRKGWNQFVHVILGMLTPFLVLCFSLHWRVSICNIPAIKFWSSKLTIYKLFNYFTYFLKYLFTYLLSL